MDRLEARVLRLERTNRRLLLLWGTTLAALAMLGAQTTNDVVRTRRLEILDEHGVPLATLAPSRIGTGGELVLRDGQGERRVTLTAEPGSATLGLQGGRAEDPSGTAALRADGEGAAFGLVGSRASVSASVRKDKPRLATTDAKGKESFAAPWKGG